MSFPFWHFAIGLSPDGWVVLYATNGDETDEEILAKAHTNASHSHVDPTTIRVVYWETCSKEERAIFDNFLEVAAFKLETGEATFRPANERADAE